MVGRLLAECAYEPLRRLGFGAGARVDAQFPGGQLTLAVPAAHIRWSSCAAVSLPGWHAGVWDRIASGSGNLEPA